MKNRILEITFLLLLNTSLFGQMGKAEYPYCIVDKPMFAGKTLVVRTDTSPNNFISTMERWHISHIGLEIIDAAERFEFQDSLSLKVKLNRRNSEIENSILRMKEIHSKTNSRAFIAGFTNNSQDTISFPVQDASLIGILEAMDKNKNWNPIQFWPISGCGNSYFSPRLFPGETLLITVDNNFGTEETKMRFKLHGNDTIFISNEFQGTVNQSVFNKMNNSTDDFRYILCDSIFYLEKPLFGDFEVNLDREIHFDEYTKGDE